MNEPTRLNNAPIIDQIEGHYDKFLMLILKKYVPEGAVITQQDFIDMLRENQSDDPYVLFTHGHIDNVEFKVIRTSAAEKIAAHTDAMVSRRKQ